jgi:hypothetical protein
LTDKVHDEPADKLTPLKPTEEEPSTAVAVPPQLLDKPFGVATTKPLGKESVKFTPVSAVAAFGLLIVKDKVVEVPVRIGLAVKDFAITGGAITVNDDVPYPLDVVFGPVLVEETLLLTFV